MCIPKVDNYLTDEKVKDFVAINFREYFKSIKEEWNLRKASKSLHIFLTTHDEVEQNVQLNSSDNCIHHYNVEILNLFDQELQLINIKPVINRKINKLLSELKTFRVKTIPVLDYKKRNDCKIFYSCTKLIASDSDIDEAFKSMHQTIMTKKIMLVKIVLDVITKHIVLRFLILV